MIVTSSAPARVCLSGEHAVVYGYPALLSSIGLYSEITARMNVVDKELFSKMRDWFISRSANESIQDYREQSWAIQSDFFLQVESTIPRGTHLASSAAISVALAGMIEGFSSFLQLGKSQKNFSLEKEKVNKTAYEIEKFHHGNPSGMDNAVCTYGGFISFQKDEKKKSSFIRHPNFWYLSEKKNWWLVHTGTPKETTKEMIQIVRENNQERERNRIFSEIEKIVHQLEAYMLISSSKEKQKIMSDSDLCFLLNESGKLLEQLGVVSQKVMDFSAIIRKFGGGIKIVGGGGKTDSVGTMLLYHPTVELLNPYIQQFEYEIEPCIFEKKGIKVYVE